MRDRLCVVYSPLDIHRIQHSLVLSRGSTVPQNRGVIGYRIGQLTESFESSFLIHQDVYYDLFVCP